MKKALMIVLAILISVAFVTTVLAQDAKKADKPAAAATDKPAAATDKPVKDKVVDKAKKAGVKKFEGEFVSKDDAAKTIVVKGETEMTFDVAKAKMGKVAAGDKVVVVYVEKDGKNIAKSVTKAGAAKKIKEKKEKKDEKAATDKPAADKPATDKPADKPAKK